MDYPTQEIKVAWPAPRRRRKGPIIALSVAAATLVGGGVTAAVLLLGDGESQAAPPVTTTRSTEPSATTTVSAPSSEPPVSPTTSSAAAPTSSKPSASVTRSSAPVDEVAQLNKTADQFTAALLAANRPALVTLVCDPGRIGQLQKPTANENVKRSGNAKVNGTTGSVMLTITADGRTATESFNARKQNSKWCLTLR